MNTLRARRGHNVKRRPWAASLFAAALLANCGLPLGAGATPSATAPTTASPTATPTATPTPSPTPTSTDTFVVANVTGGVFRIDPNRAPRQIARACADTLIDFTVAPNKQIALAVCSDATGIGSGVLVDLVRGTTKAVPIRLVGRRDVAAWAPDSRMLALIETLPPDGTPAPTPPDRVLVYDIETGQSREARPKAYLTSDLHWTPLGLSVFAPASASDPMGTYIWDGKTWSHYSELALVVADSSGRSLLESRGGSISGVWEHRAGHEDAVSGPGFTEAAVALLDDDRVVTWRLPGGPNSGVVVVSRNRTELLKMVNEQADCRPHALSGTRLWCALIGQRLIAFDVSSGQVLVYDPHLPPSGGRVMAVEILPSN